MKGGTSAVGVLSATKQRRSLGASRKREKAAKKKPTRTTVVNPNDTEWPDVDDAVAQEILRQVESSMQCLRFPVRHCPLKVVATLPKEKRAEARKEWIAQQNLEKAYDVTKYVDIRSEVSIGVNVCQRCIEADLLLAVIIEKNVEPQIITKLLVPIANSKGIPIVSVTGLKAAAKKACGISCIALGFKRECLEVVSPFYPVLLTLLENIRPDLFENTISSQIVSTPAPAQQCPEPESSDIVSSGDIQIQGSLNTAPKTKKTFSIEAEVEKWEKRVYGDKRVGDAHGQSYVTPKIRKVTKE